MATVIQTTLTDDVDGNKADETVVFSLDGADYTIDLSKKNAAALRRAAAEFVAAARPVPRATFGTSRSPTRRAPERSASSTPKAELDAIRAWARTNGVAVADRGRISAQVLNLYDAR